MKKNCKKQIKKNLENIKVELDVSNYASKTYFKNSA